MRKDQLRDEARGQECQIRSPECNWDDETTVLCHLNHGGMGGKVHDFLAATGCSACNAWCDGGYTQGGYTKQDADFALYQGVIRTQEILLASKYEVRECK